MPENHPNKTSVSQLLMGLRKELRTDAQWSEIADGLASKKTGHGIHIAVFVEPYLEYILEGKKTLESRFGVNRCPPYGRVRQGDILLLKRSGGPIVAICQVKQVWFYRLDPESWDQIRLEYSQGLCAQDPEFWKDRASASFATIMRIDKVRRITPFGIPKKDRRGWVLLSQKSQNQGHLFA